MAFGNAAVLLGLDSGVAGLCDCALAAQEFARA